MGNSSEDVASWQISFYQSMWEFHHIFRVQPEIAELVCINEKRWENFDGIGMWTSRGSLQASLAPAWVGLALKVIKPSWAWLDYLSSYAQAEMHSAQLGNSSAC